MYENIAQKDMNKFNVKKIKLPKLFKPKTG